VRRLCLTLLLVSFLSPLLLTEEIELKDGSKITGTLTSIDGSIFHVKTAYGEIQVPRSDVVTIRFPENSTVKGDAGKGDAGSATPVDERLDGTTYSNRTAHFQAIVPPSWSLAPELRTKKGMVAALQSEDQAHFLFVTQEKYSGDLKTYELLAETEIQSNFQDFEKLSEGPAKLDGRPGMRVVYKGNKGSMKLKFVVYFISYENLMTRLTFGTLDPLFDDAVPVFEKIAQSYHSTSDKPIARLTLQPVFQQTKPALDFGMLRSSPPL
jgi:small nuclear ribonucleoprotein (snRNP)-like protein